MIQARLLETDRKPFEVYCLDGEAVSKGTLVVRGGGGVMFEPDLLGEGATPPVASGPAARGLILDSKRQPIIVYRRDGESMDKGVLTVRPGGTILFQPKIELQNNEEESAEEDRRAARRQARAEGVDPREVAPVA